MITLDPRACLARSDTSTISARPPRESSRRGCRRRCRAAGSSRSRAPSPGGRSPGASRSPRGCRPSAFFLRPAEQPFHADLVRHLKIEHEVERPAELLGRLVERSRHQAVLRGNPSETKPSCASSSRAMVADEPDRQLVGDERAGGRGWARPPGRAASASIAARSMSPVAMCGISYSVAVRAACVPLPDPCGPRIRTFSDNASLQEALVAAHHHLRLHLPHRVERNTDHDRQRRAARKFCGSTTRSQELDEERRYKRTSAR